MPDNPRFWNLLARHYSRRPIGDPAAYRTKLEKTREYLTPDSEVLEIGCGTGGTARLHAPFVRHVRAIDFSPKMIAIARERQAQERVGNVNFEVARIGDIGDGRVYDAVLAMSVLHLLPDWRDVIGRVFGLVRPGGVFVSSTTCIDPAPALMKAVLPVARAIGLLPPLQFLTAETVVAGIESAGFTIDHRWRPRPDAAIFIVARKPG